MGQKWRQIISPTRKRHGHDTDTTLTRLSPQFCFGPTRTRHGHDTDTLKPTVWLGTDTQPTRKRCKTGQR